MDNSKELVSRKEPNNKDSVITQIEYYSYLFQKMGVKEIIIADDVVFSGSVLKTIIQLFAQKGIKVIGIRACISTEESFRYFNKYLRLGLKCGFLISNQVIDQICERDFYYGIAGSGISVRKNNRVVKAPYFKPFGNPIERASIPELEEMKFSLSCLRRSLELWQEMEKINRNIIYNSDLPEIINNTKINDSVTKTLMKGMNSICIK